MRRCSTNREKELNMIVEPYYVYKNGGYLKESAPDSVKSAYEELLKIGASEKGERAQNL